MHHWSSLWSSLLLAAIGNPVSSRAWAVFLGCFLAVVALGLLILSWTRLGQSKLLSKCIAIAMLAHIWILLYAYGTRIPYGTQGSGHGAPATSSASEIPTGPLMVAWTPMDSLPDPLSLRSDEGEPADLSSQREPNETPLWNQPIELPAESLAQLQLPDLESPEHLTEEALQSLVESQAELAPELSDDRMVDKPVDTPVDTPADRPVDKPLNKPLDLNVDLPVDLPIDSSLIAMNDAAAVLKSPDRVEPKPSVPTGRLAQVPAAYRLRMSPERHAATLQNGGDANTEQAVRMALAFLAKTQLADGSWNAQQNGAGQGGSTSNTDNIHRLDTGKYADTAMTGLALLAFLGAGHTHIDAGPYQSNVRSALAYLVQQQFPSGDLSGRGQIGSQPTVRYSRMYSHGIAGIALAEAYAMTQDPAILEPIRSAAVYSLKAMNPKTGGWRYDFASDDPGDMSQFGWQAMLLSSASTSNAMPLQGSHRVLLQRFLDSVSTGSSGGLAVYRNLNPAGRPPREQATAAMTAEALAIRSMLDLPISSQATQEARQMLLSELPGKGEPNFYYWYYATLALYQNKTKLEGWSVWNEAMKKELVGSQLQQGDMAGSWDPRCVWGGHGGRIYTTALACMCLEVYYRYLPIYQQIP